MRPSHLRGIRATILLQPMPIWPGLVPCRSCLTPRSLPSATLAFLHSYSSPSSSTSLFARPRMAGGSKPPSRDGSTGSCLPSRIARDAASPQAGRACDRQSFCPGDDGSSPLAGRACDRQSVCPRHRLIPACGAARISVNLQATPRMAHPRTRGLAAAYRQRDLIDGFIPARGAPAAVHSRRKLIARFIPTRGDTRFCACDRHPAGSIHPRTRGEQQCPFRPEKALIASSSPVGGIDTLR